MLTSVNTLISNTHFNIYSEQNRCMDKYHLLLMKPHVQDTMMPIVAMFGLVGNILYIVVLHSPGVDMKVNTLLGIVVIIILIIVLHSNTGVDMHEGIDTSLRESRSSCGVWTRI